MEIFDARVRRKELKPQRDEDEVQAVGKCATKWILSG